MPVWISKLETPTMTIDESAMFDGVVGWATSLWIQTRSWLSVATCFIPKTAMEDDTLGEHMVSDILLFILSRIDVRAVVRCSSVCKRWRDIILSNSANLFWLEIAKRQYGTKEPFRELVESSRLVSDRC